MSLGACCEVPFERDIRLVRAVWGEQGGDWIVDNVVRFHTSTVV